MVQESVSLYNWAKEVANICYQATPPSPVCDMIANTTEKAVSPVPMRMIKVSLCAKLQQDKNMKAYAVMSDAGKTYLQAEEQRNPPD